MNGVNLLMEDHRKIEKLFSDLQTALAERRVQLVRDLKNHLLAHMKAEEEVLYPVLKSGASDEVEHALDEHAIARELLEQLVDVVDDPMFVDRLQELMQSVQDHIREEEAPGGLMGIASQQFSEADVSAMAEEIDRIKRPRPPKRRSASTTSRAWTENYPIGR